VVKPLLEKLNGKLSEAEKKYLEKAFQRLQNQLLDGPISALTEEMLRDDAHEGHTLLEALRKTVRAARIARITGVGQRGPSMSERFKVRVTKDHLVFCSGHFISYEGDRCERLHGHNYRTAVEVEGGLDENQYVFDFIALKHRTRAITDELDHRMMLATRNPAHRRRGGAGGRQRALPRAALAVPARRLRPVAHREHDGRAAGSLHRPTDSSTNCGSTTASRRNCCASRWRRTSASRRRSNGARSDPHAASTSIAPPMAAADA